MSDLVLPPIGVRRTGDDTPASSLFVYVKRMSGEHQLFLSLLAIIIAGLSMVPLELQRRIVDGAVANGDMRLLLVLGGIYLGVVVVQALGKYVLRVYQNWVSESAIRYTRGHLASIYECRRATVDRHEEGGEAVSVIGNEVEKLGAFVGEAIAEPIVNGGMILAILGYMLVVEPMLALISLIFFIPQAIAVPILQRLINRLVEHRIDLLRRLGTLLARGEEGTSSPCDVSEEERGKFDEIYSNRMRTYLLKYASKTIVNFFNNLAPVSVLLVGGYLVIQGQTEIGVVVAFISGFDRLADPLRELITYYRTATQSSVRHDTIARWI